MIHPKQQHGHKVSDSAKELVKSAEMAGNLALIALEKHPTFKPAACDTL